MAIQTLPEALPKLTLVAAWVISLGATCTVFWKLFDWLEQTASEVGRKRLASWLLKPKESDATWGEAFLAMFNALFGQRHWSVLCLFCSAVSSLVAVLCLFPVAASFYPFAIVSMIDAWRDDAARFVVFVLTFFFANVLGDFVSLWETRLILRLLAQVSPLKAIALLMLDAFLTAYVFTVSFLVSTAVFAVRMGESAAWFPSIPWVAPRVLLTQLEAGVGRPGGVVFFLLLATAYVTSIWLYVFVGSRVVVLLLSSMRERLRSWWRFLDVEHQPLRSLGTASVLVVTATYIVVTLVAMIWSRW